MMKFPFNFKIKSLTSKKDGFTLTTGSDEAAECFDAFVTQMAFLEKVKSLKAKTLGNLQVLTLYAEKPSVIPE